ncbi:MAG: DNA-protecting protein DprA [Lachnospiraceae bacterium]|nr:DNA-protecting protein DprA [Lachnospiraceae bacterium]
MALCREEYWFWYCSLERVEPAIRNKLRESMGSPESVYGASRKFIEKILTPLYYKKTVERIWNELVKSRNKEEIQKNLAQMKQLGIRMVTADDREFPEKLFVLPDCPSGLFVKGRLPAAESPAVAVVGSRNCSYYGRNTAKTLGRILAEAGVQVVSGLARGIDAAGHEGAVMAGGPTFGVLGCGVDVVYPWENHQIYEKVEEAGGLISEYPPGTRPSPWHFPARNRIISGLSDCVVVVEAGAKSGSLITASLALEQGKDIWAVPGRMGDFLSVGTNRLIRDGAMPLTEPEEILEGWNLQRKKLRIYKKTKLSLDKNVEKVYSCLDSDPKSEEQLLVESGIDSRTLAACLVDLEMEGLAVQPFRHYYAAKRDKGE